MKRKQEADLLRWFDHPHRKPLVIRGARQVGKSTLIRNFCEEKGLKLIEINFEEDTSLKQLFSSNDPQKIISTLETIRNVRIDIAHSLLFLDEIQAQVEVIASLRYFYEKMPQLAVIAAGSLLEFALEDTPFSVPVGRIEYLFMGPLTFEEFLEGMDEKHMLTYLENFTLTDHIPEAIHNRALELVRTYMLLGGMPEVVEMYRTTGSLLEADKVKYSILNTYRDDFAKYMGKFELSLLQTVFDRLGTTVGKKIRYVDLLPAKRSTISDRILNLFVSARIFYRVAHSGSNALPLKAEIKTNYSKGLFLDVGLFLALSGLSIGEMATTENLFFSNSGALAEQYIGQHLLYSQPGYKQPELYCWSREKAQSNAELDYVMQLSNQVMPVEVKAGKTGTLRSLHLFMEQKQLSTALRFSTHTPVVEEIVSPAPSTYSYTLVSLPFYLVGQSSRLMNTLING